MKIKTHISEAARRALIERIAAETESTLLRIPSDWGAALAKSQRPETLERMLKTICADALAKVNADINRAMSDTFQSDT